MSSAAAPRRDVSRSIRGRVVDHSRWGGTVLRSAGGSTGTPGEKEDDQASCCAGSLPLPARGPVPFLDSQADQILGELGRSSIPHGLLLKRTSPFGPDRARRIQKWICPLCGSMAKKGDLSWFMWAWKWEMSAGRARTLP